MKNGGIFCGRLAFLCLFGIVYGHLEYFGIFFPFWLVVQRKIWQPSKRMWHAA
jgi:hypothetical protein